MSNNICLVCFKKINYSVRWIFEKKIYVCSSCLEQMNPNWKKISINNIKGYAIYPYENKIKKLLFQFKGCNDIALAPVFFSPFYWYFYYLSKRYVFVPIPSFQDHDLKRGFNHVEEMLNSLHISYIKCIKKVLDIKQSSLNEKERKLAKKYFALIKENVKKIIDKKVILVDDVVTTSSTLSACVELLKMAKIKIFKVIVMSYTCRDKGEFGERI